MLDFRENSHNSEDDKDDTDEEEASVELFQSMSDDCLVNMKQCRDNDVLCDAQFEVDGRIVRAHKIVLASRSQYFRAMFTSQMKESFECVIKISNVSYKIFSSIIDFLYTGQIELTNHNIESLFHLSHLYDIRQLQIICISYIHSHLCLYNCKNLYLLCVLYRCTYHLIGIIHAFICDHFDLIVSSGEISHWSYDDLRLIFYDVARCFTLVKLPVEFHQRRFLEWLESHYSQLSPCDRNSLAFQLEQLQPINLDNKLFKFIHHFHKVMFVVGGICDGDLINSPECLPLDYAAHQKSTPTSSLVAPISVPTDAPEILPTAPHKKGVAFAGVASDLRNVYILGGLISRKKNIKLSDKVYTYSVVENHWSLHSSLPCGGVEGIAAVYRNERSYDEDRPRLYACGGRTVRNSAMESSYGRTEFSYLNNLWVFIRDEWVSLPSMSVKRAFHGMVFYCDEIYVIGGQGEDGEPLSSIEIYNPELKQWRLSSAELIIPRSHLCTLVSREYIYAIAGNMAIASQEYKHHTLHQYAPQERYNIRSNRWELLAEKSLPHLTCIGALCDESRIVLCGGKTSLRDNNTVLKRRLDASCGTAFWHPLTPLVRKRWGHMVALLQVPVYQDCSYLI